MPKKLASLEVRLGYKFQDLKLLERALTHRSWAHEHLPEGPEESVRALQNESFEFVGDAVLGLAVSEQLFVRNPTVSEGDLTLMKHQLVSADTLARIAADLEMGEFIRVGKGEEKTGGRRKQALLADALEAVIAAVFFDSGYVSARATVNRLFADHIKAATPRTALDYKTLLQETLQSNKLPAPTYRVVSTEGPPHRRTFRVEASWQGGSTTASGSSIKQAEMAAAQEALEILGSSGPEKDERPRI